LVITGVVLVATACIVYEIIYKGDSDGGEGTVVLENNDYNHPGNRGGETSDDGGETDSSNESNSSGNDNHNI